MNQDEAIAKLKVLKIRADELEATNPTEAEALAAASTIAWAEFHAEVECLSKITGIPVYEIREAVFKEDK